MPGFDQLRALLARLLSNVGEDDSSAAERPAQGIAAR
jgi:hypothetical protein